MGDGTRARLEAAGINPADFLLARDLAASAADRALESIRIVANTAPPHIRSHVELLALRRLLKSNPLVEIAMMIELSATASQEGSKP